MTSQSQESLQDQMKTLAHLAAKEGLYDAQDFLLKWLAECERKQNKD